MAIYINPNADPLDFLRMEEFELQVASAVLNRTAELQDKRRSNEIEALGITIANKIARMFG